MRRKIISISFVLSAIFYFICTTTAFAQLENSDNYGPSLSLIAQFDEDDDFDDTEIAPDSDTIDDTEASTGEVRATEPATAEEDAGEPPADESATTPATDEQDITESAGGEGDEEEFADSEEDEADIGDEEDDRDVFVGDEEEDRDEFAGDEEGEEESATGEGEVHEGKRRQAPPAHTANAKKGSHGGARHDWVPPLWSVIGFVGLLLSIAIIPLINEHWWEPNLHKGYVALIFGIPVLIYLIIHAPQNLKHTMIEYMSFMALLGSLFYISGGIFLKGDIEATPRNNTLFIAAGTVLASFVGTTGAAMLLIRPVLRTNGERERKMHTVIFFIFLVCNIGGSLTPMGDPPLFMGYLRGVPFTWTFNLWIQWLPMSLVLLAIYYVLDVYHYKREKSENIKWDKRQIMPLKLMGNINFLWLLGVVASIYYLTPNNVASWFGESLRHVPLREVCMVLMALISWRTTPKGVREAQSFSMHPIIEVAVLFAGIFVTMVPALMLLEIKGPEMGVTKPWQFFWFTGMLSSFLDNTPTYLVFFELGKSISHGSDLIAGLTYPILEAISIGAVFMGANTYIGNGPNFMVKAIAEENSVKMPSFFGYMIWSMGILLPLFVAVTFVYFR